MLHLTMLVALAATTQYGYYPAQGCAGGNCGAAYYTYQQPAYAPHQAYQYSSHYDAPRANASAQPAANANRSVPPANPGQVQPPARPQSAQPHPVASPYQAAPAYSYYQSYYYYPAGSSCASGYCGGR